MALGLDGSTYSQRKVDDNLYVMSMDTGRALAEYAQLTLKLPYFAPIGPLGNIVELFSMAAPGVREILSVGKLCYEIHEDNYDLVIADASATGHVSGILGTSRNVHNLTSAGIIRDQTSWMDDILYNPAQTSIAIATTAQETPIAETLELLETLSHSSDHPGNSVFVNRVPSELFNRREESIFRTLTGELGKPARAEKKTADEMRRLDSLFSAADLAIKIRRSEEVQLKYFESSLQLQAAAKEGDSPETYYVPYLFMQGDPFDMTKQIALHLAEELSIELS